MEEIRHSRHSEQRPLTELFSELAHETGTLIQKEVELAKAEMTAKASKASKDLVKIAVGGVVAFAGALALVAGLIVIFDHVLPLWLSALLVGGLVSAAGGLLAYQSVRALKRVDPAPRQTIQTFRENKQWLKEQTAR